MTYIIDIEADNFLLEATKVWCAVLHDTTSNSTLRFTNIEEFVKKLNEADCQIVGHNIMMYDLPLLRRLYGLKYKVSKVYDTILVSRMLEPDRLGGHSLEAWGKRLGVEKGKHTDFSKYSPGMLDYCEQDVMVTLSIFKKQSLELQNYPGIERSIKLEHEFAYLINKQIEAGFTLDVEKAKLLAEELTTELSFLKQSLKEKMKPVPIMTHFKSCQNKGLILSHNNEEYTYTCRNLVKVKKFDYEEPNPTSRQQIADYLIGKGWKPTIFTETGLPKIDETALTSVQIPEAKDIQRMFRVQKMLGMLQDGDNAWLKLVKPSGRVHGDIITNGTNTGRVSHSRPNMSQVDKDKSMRGCWKAQEGWKLVGTDASGLELRILGHYLVPYDKGAFAHEVVNGDIHTYNQKNFKLDSRDDAKTMIYACVPTNTQALTRNGWKYYDDLVIGEEILAYNQVTNLKEWSKLTHVLVKEDEVVELDTGYKKLYATKDHRWFVKQRRMGSKAWTKINGRYMESQVRTTEELNTESSIIMNAPFNTEQDVVSSVNGLAGKYDVNYIQRVLQMSHAERVQFVQGFLLADGYIDTQNNWQWVQNNTNICEGLKLASYLVHDGQVSFTYKKGTNQDMTVARLSKKPHITCQKLRKKSIGIQKVWCPTTELGSWVMKQGEVITITGNCIYGAGNIKLGYIKTKLRDDEVNRKVGGRVRNNVADNFVGYVDLLEDVKKAFKLRGYLRGIDNRPLHPRQEYSALNLLIQSAGALIMKQAMINSFKLLLDKGYKNGLHYNYVAAIHDEYQLECLPEIAEVVGETMVEAIRKAGKDFQLKCKLDGEYKVGDTWAETH